MARIEGTRADDLRTDPEVSRKVSDSKSADLPVLDPVPPVVDLCPPEDVESKMGRVFHLDLDFREVNSRLHDCELNKANSPHASTHLGHQVCRRQAPGGRYEPK